MGGAQGRACGQGNFQWHVLASILGQTLGAGQRVGAGHSAHTVGGAQVAQRAGGGHLGHGGGRGHLAHTLGLAQTSQMTVGAQVLQTTGTGQLAQTAHGMILAICFWHLVNNLSHVVWLCAFTVRRSLLDSSALSMVLILVFSLSLAWFRLAEDFFSLTSRLLMESTWFCNSSRTES